MLQLIHSWVFNKPFTFHHIPTLTFTCGAKTTWNENILLRLIWSISKQIQIHCFIMALHWENYEIKDLWSGTHNLGI